MEMEKDKMNCPVLTPTLTQSIANKLILFSLRGFY